jgi:hypothetical protein
MMLTSSCAGHKNFEFLTSRQGCQIFLDLMYQNCYNELPQYTANCHKIKEMATKHTKWSYVKDMKISHSMGFQNCPKLGVGLKINHLATLVLE